MEPSIREFSLSDLDTIRELILRAENFGAPFLENEMKNIKKNTELGLGKVFVATSNDEVIGYISLGRRVFALMVTR